MIRRLIAPLAMAVVTLCAGQSFAQGAFPAPLPGQDTREICHKVLGMSSDETEQLINDGVLFASADTA